MNLLIACSDLASQMLRPSLHHKVAVGVASPTTSPDQNTRKTPPSTATLTSLTTRNIDFFLSTKNAEHTLTFPSMAETSVSTSTRELGHCLSDNHDDC